MRNRLDIQLRKNIDEAVGEFQSLSSPHDVAALLEIPYPKFKADFTHYAML